MQLLLVKKQPPMGALALNGREPAAYALQFPTTQSETIGGYDITLAHMRVPERRHR